jgi:hypothetical protein
MADLRSVIPNPPEKQTVRLSRGRFPTLAGLRSHSRVEYLRHLLNHLRVSVPEECCRGGLQSGCRRGEE